MDFDTVVRLHVYDTIARTGLAPTTVQAAGALGAPLGDVEAAYRSVHAQRLLLLEPGDRSRIRMAAPFSGVPTAFHVRAAGADCYANCVWDSLGILAALHRDGVVEARDGQTGEPIVLEVRDGQLVPEPCVIHFAVPVARWAEDVIHT